MLQAIKIGYIIHKKSEIRIFLRKRLVRELGKTDHFEFFTQHLEPTNVSSVRISCNLVKRLTGYKQKFSRSFFFGAPCMYRVREKFPYTVF